MQFEPLVLCNKVADVPRHKALTGSTVERCAECRAEIWVSPLTRRTAQQYRRLCLDCGGREIDKRGGAPEFRLMPGQLDVIAKQLAQRAEDN